MAYDEVLAQRVRELLADRHDVREQRMFGGIAFMGGGHMTVGVINDDLMARVGKDAHEELIAKPHAREMDFTKRPMDGFLYVGPEGVATKRQLRTWIDRCLAFTTSLPPK
ncbi:MAG: TfoX/Sxy family protein [Nitriliruptorales bacterium]|nr:TfoX/Sxy family protein [Nitriliruptorales bacterium]